MRLRLASSYPIVANCAVVLLVAESAVSTEDGRGFVPSHPLPALGTVVLFAPEGAVVAQQSLLSGHLIVFRSIIIGDYFPDAT